jgi:hypothetical protein
VSRKTARVDDISAILRGLFKVEVGHPLRWMALQEELTK